MSDTYRSSTIFKYGDTDRVTQDTKTLNEILSRQGDSLLIDVLAEAVGHTANTFKLNETERQRLINHLTTELNEALKERL